MMCVTRAQCGAEHVHTTGTAGTRTRQVGVGMCITWRLKQHTMQWHIHRPPTLAVQCRQRVAMHTRPGSSVAPRDRACARTTCIAHGSNMRELTALTNTRCHSARNPPSFTPCVWIFSKCGSMFATDSHSSLVDARFSGVDHWSSFLCATTKLSNQASARTISPVVFSVCRSSASVPYSNVAPMLSNALDP